jgi:MoaA/NifB/PqqE/SkfB family radical SAM enzyme
MKDWTKNFSEQYVLIELTDCCNLKCPMCSHVRGEPPHGGDKMGFMEFDLYKRIIKELSPKNKPVAWKLFWLGEPLPHPQLDKILYFTYDEIKDFSRKEYLDIHTNGLLLTPEITEVLLDMNYKLPRLTLSIDAATSETYNRVRCGGDYQKLLDTNLLII